MGHCRCEKEKSIFRGNRPRPCVIQIRCRALNKSASRCSSRELSPLPDVVVLPAHETRQTWSTCGNAAATRLTLLPLPPLSLLGTVVFFFFAGRSLLPLPPPLLHSLYSDSSCSSSCFVSCPRAVHQGLLVSSRHTVALPRSHLVGWSRKENYSFPSPFCVCVCVCGTFLLRPGWLCLCACVCVCVCACSLGGNITCSFELTARTHTNTRPPAQHPPPQTLSLST